MSAPAHELYDRSVDQVRRGQVRQALATLLDTLAADPAHRPAYEAAGRICRILGAPEDARLFEELATRPENPEALFRLGYRLADQGRPEVASKLLERSLAGLPADVGVRRELAFARLQGRDFVGCLRALVPLEDSPDLSETERLDVLLMQAEAALLAGRREPCREFLERAEECVPDDDQRERLDALHAQLARSARWDSFARLGLREWHFIQHAGVILKTAGGYFEDGSRKGRFDLLHLRPDMIAFLLQRLAQLLERLDLRPEAVEPATEAAAPLAHALALRLDVPVLAGPDEAGSRGVLLVGANAAEFALHAPRVARHVPELRLFSLNLDWERDAPVCPEVAGVLARRVVLPWERRYELGADRKALHELPGDEREPAAIGAELRALMEALPQDDGGAAREAFEGFYLPLRDQLVLGNDELHPGRRAFTSLSPCWSEDEDEARAGRLARDDDGPDGEG
jgi:tetratricopeptide (TPR) repeat protein